MPSLLLLINKERYLPKKPAKKRSYFLEISKKTLFHKVSMGLEFLTVQEKDLTLWRSKRKLHFIAWHCYFLKITLFVAISY